MVDIDPLTGLPKELLAMEEIVREQQSITVRIEKRRYGKLVTIVDGIGKSVDISDGRAPGVCWNPCDRTRG